MPFGNTFYDPLIVTTALDIVDANDGINSLREALSYAQRHGAGATLSFTRDCEIKLSSPLSITQNVIIDGGENKITLIGPENGAMFHVTESKVTLKNMSLISDYAATGGGILDAKDSGRMDLFSVKDGGKSDWLWIVSNKFDINLDGESHIHRVLVKPKSKGANIKIGADSVLEDLEYTGDSNNRGAGNCDVNGLLKNASVADDGDIYVNSGGTAENITVKENGFLDLRSKGKINGVNVEPKGVMGYMTDSIITGTISIGGVAWEPSNTGGNGFLLPTVSDGVQAFPVISDKDTDIVFDLTERTEDSLSFFTMRVDVTFSTTKNLVEGTGSSRLLFNDMGSFLGAHSYTIHIKEDQPSGVYLLGTQADKFNSAVSLKIGDKVYPDALVLGKEITIGDRIYTLTLDIWESRSNSFLTNYDVRNLILWVDKEAVPTPTSPKRGTFGIRVDTTPGANVVFSSPDGTAQWKETADGNGVCKTLVETPGNYSVTITKESFQSVNNHVFEVSGPGNGNITYVNLPLKPEDRHLLVTTEKDVVDPDDGVTSLREALNYAQKLNTAATVSFANDYVIKLSSPLPVLNDVTIAGGKNNVTLVGPERKPVFQENVDNKQMILANVALSESDTKGRSNRATVVLTGTFSGAGTFVFQDGKIIYKHKEWNYPSNVKINGSSWRDLNKPFDLGLELTYLTGTFVEKDKQRGHINDTQLRTSSDWAELDINNSFTYPSDYRVALSFKKKSTKK